MDTQDLVVNDCSQSQVIENVGAVFPNIQWAIFSETFVVEPVNLSNLPRLMIASD